MDYIKVFDDHLELLVWVKPGASQNQVLKPTERGLNLSVCAKAQDGKANDAVIKLMATFLDIPQSWITIFKGHHGRQKKLNIPNQENILKKLTGIH